MHFRTLFYDFITLTIIPRFKIELCDPSVITLIAVLVPTYIFYSLKVNVGPKTDDLLPNRKIEEKMPHLGQNNQPFLG